MKMSLILVVFAVLVVAATVVSQPGNTSARTLSEQEMWLTFGGQFPNDMYCEYKWECSAEAQNHCANATGGGWTLCWAHE